MKRATTFALGLALGLAAAPPVYAAEALTTGELLQDCNKPAGSFGPAYCLGVISGAAGVLLVNGNLVDVPNNGVSMCTTEFVSYGAMEQAFKN